MAKQTEQDNLQQMNAILADVKAGKFSPVYILMGEEPYYSDIIIEAILANVLEPSERDFKEFSQYVNKALSENLLNKVEFGKNKVNEYHVQYDCHNDILNVELCTQ